MSGIPTSSELYQADRAITRIQRALNTNHNVGYQLLETLKLVLECEGLLTNRVKDWRTIKFKKEVNRHQTGLFPYKNWHIEKNQDFYKGNLSYEQLLSASAYIGKMYKGQFRNCSLLAFSRNKFQLLLEAQTHFDTRILFELGVRKTAAPDWRE